VRIKEDSDTGGASMKFDQYNNYVLIRHEDGSLGHYCHLQKGGVCVKPGDTVAAGDRIARSGNTGFSSGPHLHFCVFKTKDGRERVSIPIKFKTSDENSVVLVEGRRYRATELPEINRTAGLPIAAQPKASELGRGAPSGGSSR
jgi:murein DD-endopeptidase MepM/ murein hydrolase activator NlpD